MSAFSRRVIVGVTALLAMASSPAPAAAQPVGTFRWQLQPYCNLVTLVVVHNGGVFSLDGFDDQCGAATRAPVTGLATPNPDGSIGLGLTLVTAPGATPVHVAAAINLASLGGSWRDSTGTTGNFVFTPGAGAGGSPRPTPTGLTVAALNVAGGGTVAGPLTVGSVSANGAGSFASLDTTGNAAVAGDVSAGGSGSFASLTTTGDATIGGSVFADAVTVDGFTRVELLSNLPEGAPVLSFLRGRTAGGALLDGDRLAHIDFLGALGQGSSRRTGARVSVNATENWASAHAGSSLAFWTTPNNSTQVQPRLLIDHDGRVGIGTQTPDALLSVNGAASKSGGGSWSVFSDERLKTVHGRFSRGLDALTQLEPIRFEYRADNPLGLGAGAEYVGFSAQAVQRAIPEAVSTAENGYLRLDADPILWTMLNAVKELKSENDLLKTQNDALARRLAAIEAVLAARQ